MIDRAESIPTPQALRALKPVETWHQDESDPTLWHHASGLIVNDAALVERNNYYRVIRLRIGGLPATNDRDAIGI